MSPENLLINLIQLIYEAAAEPEQWPVFLKQFAESVGSPAVTLTGPAFKNQGTTIATGVGLDPVWLRAYEDHYAGCNVWVQRGACLLRPGVVVSGSEMAPDNEFVKSEFYKDVLLPQGHFYTLRGTALHETSGVSYLTAVRSKSAGPFEEREVDLLRHLLPHLRTAVMVHQRVAFAVG